jgi:hypothetical protein
MSTFAGCERVGSYQFMLNRAAPPILWNSLPEGMMLSRVSSEAPLYMLHSRTNYLLRL